MYKRITGTLFTIAHIALWGLALLITSAFPQTVKRGRNEATLGFPASNVMGNGNINFYLASAARYSLGGFAFDPILGAQIGISDLMQLTGQFIPSTKSALGPVESHLQITLPGNENLRFLGAALLADLYLSSTQDTLSKTAQSDKPEYNPYLAASMVADVDWLAVSKALPFKTYLYFGLVDNVDLLPRYDQLSLRTAFEWKMYQHSAFASAGAGFFKEKSTRTQPAEAAYSQNYVWIEPGGRYRFFNRFSLIGALKLTLFQNAKTKNPFQPELFKISIKAEAPILFKETNTEAIRTLVFMEKKKGKNSDSFEKNVAVRKNVINDMSTALMGQQDSLEPTDADLKENIIKRREETQKKMDEVETLFRSLDLESQPKVPLSIDSTKARKQ